MLSEPADHFADVHALRHALRSGLRTALKVSDTEAVAALRTTIAAIDNAEAVEVSDQSPHRELGQATTGARGVGSTDVPRRALSAAQLRAIVGRHVDEYENEAAHYASLEQSGAAQRLRARANILRSYL